MSKNDARSRLEAICLDICVSEFEPAPLCAPHLLDQAGVAQREDGEQPHLLEAVELTRDKRTLATPAQDQHRSDGFAERERHDRGVVHGEQQLSEFRVGVSAFAEAAAVHDRAGGDSLIQQRLPRQPAQWVLMADEVRGATALVAGLHPKYVLVEAGQRAAIDVGVLGRKADEAFHDLVRVPAGYQVRLDQPWDSGRFKQARIQV